MRKILFFFFLSILVFGCSNQEKTADNNNDETQETPENVAPQDGIGFKALGHEPTWTFEMDFNKEIRMLITESTGHSKNIVVPIANPFRMNNPDAIRYRSNSGEWSVIATIFPFGCQDSETGDNYNYQVIVKVISSTTPYEETFQGCGNYEGGYSYEGTVIPQPQVQ